MTPAELLICLSVTVSLAAVGMAIMIAYYLYQQCWSKAARAQDAAYADKAMPKTSVLGPAHTIDPSVLLVQKSTEGLPSDQRVVV
jgi:hypothetical protein